MNVGLELQTEEQLGYTLVGSQFDIGSHLHYGNVLQFAGEIYNRYHPMSTLPYTDTTCPVIIGVSEYTYDYAESQYYDSVVFTTWTKHGEWDFNTVTILFVVN